MTDPVGPSTPPAPVGSGGGAATGAGATGMLARLDDAGRSIAAGGATAIVIVVLGLVVGAWELTGFALVVLLAAIVALVIAFVASPSASASWPVPARDVALLAGVVMSVLAVLAVLELVFDLDDLDDRGGVLGAILTIGLAAASLAVFVGAIMARRGSDLAGAAARRSDRGTRLALAGLGLDLVAWLVMLTISVYALGQTSSFGIAASVLAVLILVLGSDPNGGWRIPIPAAWIAVGLSIVAVIALVDQFGQYNRINERVGLEALDSILFFAHAIAVLLILAGSLLSAVDRQRSVGASPAT
jgi:hypothetical protein